MNGEFFKISNSIKEKSKNSKKILEQNPILTDFIVISINEIVFIEKLSTFLFQISTVNDNIFLISVVFEQDLVEIFLNWETSVIKFIVLKKNLKFFIIMLKLVSFC